MGIALIFIVPWILWVVFRDKRALAKDWKNSLKVHEDLKATKVPETEKYLDFFNLARQNYILYKVSNEDPRVAVFLLENMRRTLSGRVQA